MSARAAEPHYRQSKAIIVLIMLLIITKDVGMCLVVCAEDIYKLNLKI